MQNGQPPVSTHSAVIWQGFQHAWSYNHRLNRLGSYVTQNNHNGRPSKAYAVHTAASGTGGDTAVFTEFATFVDDVQGVSFLPGVAETQLECQRGDPEPFVIRIDDLNLPPEMQNRDVVTVIINGFDLIATEHSEKLMTLDAEVTDPVLINGGTQARFHILGGLCFDCRSSECQLLPLRLEVERVHPKEEGDPAEDEDDYEEPSDDVSQNLPRKQGIDRHKIDRAAHWLKQRIVNITDVEGVKRSIVGDEGDILRRQLVRLFGRRIFFKFLKWRISAPYTLRVHYLIIAGDQQSLRVTESGEIEHGYDWDMDDEITKEATGVCPVTVTGGDPSAYAVNTLAFKRIRTQIIIDEERGSEDPIQWGKGMHLLEWNLAVRDLVPTETGVEAKMDLFYKNWSEAMNEVLTLTTWGAVRAAGSAQMGARLALLQFRQAQGGVQQRVPGRISWPGGGLSAERDRRARSRRSIALPTQTEP